MEQKYQVRHYDGWGNYLDAMTAEWSSLRDAMGAARKEILALDPGSIGLNARAEIWAVWVDDEGTVINERDALELGHSAPHKLYVYKEVGGTASKRKLHRCRCA